MNELLWGVAASFVYAATTGGGLLLYRHRRRKHELPLLRRRLESLRRIYAREWLYTRGAFYVLVEQMGWLSEELRPAAAIEGNKDLELLYFYLRRVALNVRLCAQFNARVTRQVAALTAFTPYLSASQRTAVERLVMAVDSVHSQLQSHAEACTHFLEVFGAAYDHVQQCIAADSSFDCTTYQFRRSSGRNITASRYTRTVACNALESAAQFAHLFSLWSVRHETIYAPLQRLDITLGQFGRGLAEGLEFDWNALELRALEKIRIDAPENLAVAHITLSLS